MIQLLIIIVGIAILASIFIRRYMMVEKGVASFSFFHRKRNFLDLLHMHREKDALEVTVEEMIPEQSTVDLRKVAKAAMLAKKADAVLSKDDLRAGEKLLIQSLALDPSNSEVYHKLGLIYLRQGQFGKAEQMYQKLIVTIQNDPVYFSNLAMALYQQKKFPEAKTHYLKAIELDSSRPGRFFSLAQVMKELNEVEASLANFRKALEMDPANLDYLLTLAQVYMEMKMNDDAKILLTEILAVYPNNEIAKDMMRKLIAGKDEGHPPSKNDAGHETEKT